MKHADNWGWRARIGMFIVANEAVPEAEWWAMAPSGVSIHAARVQSSAPWARWQGDDASEVSLSEDLARGAGHFASMRLEAVTLGHTSSSIAGGSAWDEAAVRALTALLPDTRVTTNGLDCVAALGALDAQSPFLVFPPWFASETVAAGVEYFAAKGVNAAGHLQADPGRGWRDMAPQALYPQGLGFEQDVEHLFRQICRACPDEADSVLITGTGFRCVAVLDALEQALGRPVVSANQASLWHCMRLAGLPAHQPGYGRLLDSSHS